MSVDNGLLVKKNSEGSFDVYYLAADNQFYENTFEDLETLIRWIQEQQESFILEYGTREQTDWQHENALKWKETCDELEDEKNQWKGRYLELNEDREQEMTDEDRKEIIDLDAELTAKDVEIERLRAMLSYPLAAFGTPELVGWIAEMQKLVDDTPESERGQIPFVMQMGALLERGMNSWQSSKIKELETRWHQKYEELYRITENYIKCLHKKEEECKRLEADFMKSHTIPIIKDGEYIRLHEKEAREALEKIKQEGGKDEGA